MIVNGYSYLLVQDERQAALIELNAMEKKHKELQVLSLVAPNICALIVLMVNFAFQFVVHQGSCSGCILYLSMSFTISCWQEEINKYADNDPAVYEAMSEPSPLFSLETQAFLFECFLV